MEIIERKQAVALGLTRYNNGNPCPKGHNPPVRFTSTMQCCQCAKGYQNNYRKRTLSNQARSRSGYAEIRMYVHKASYDLIYQYIQTVNRLMSVPDSINDPAVEQDMIGVPREWADNPFDRAPSKLPVDDIAHYLKQHHARGRMLDFTMDSLTGRCWPGEENGQPVPVVAPGAAVAVPEYVAPDPEERHF